MTEGLRIARQWTAEDGTQSRLAELINEAIAACQAREAVLVHELRRLEPGVHDITPAAAAMLDAVRAARKLRDGGWVVSGGGYGPDGELLHALQRLDEAQSPTGK